IYPLIIMKEENISEITPVSLVSNLVRGMPSAKGKAYQLPPDQPSYQAKENAINNLMEKIEKLDNYLVGIGYIESLQDSRERQRAESREGEFNALVANLDLCEVLEKSGACGEIAHQPFDENGSIVDIDSEEFPDLRKLRKCFLCLSLTTLKNRAAVPGVNVVAIGGGYNKVKAIHAALKGKFFNALITDAVVADTILRLERKRSNRLREVNA
ncbi:MAG: sugar-binding domain-containing protein, partial [Candidatus Binatia bacterium]